MLFLRILNFSLEPELVDVLSSDESLFIELAPIPNGNDIPLEEEFNMVMDMLWLSMGLERMLFST